MHKSIDAKSEDLYYLLPVSAGGNVLLGGGPLALPEHGQPPPHRAQQEPGAGTVSSRKQEEKFSAFEI